MAEKKDNNAIFKVINENIVVKVEKKRSQAIVYSTPEYKLLLTKNTEIDTYNAEYQEVGLGRKRRKQRYIAQRLFK